MIYVSLVEIFDKAKHSLLLSLGDKPGYWITVIAFFGGILIVAMIDKLIPEFENPHEISIIKQGFPVTVGKSKKLFRMGMFSAIAIAIHNIPEGIAVSAPIYYPTKNKKKVFWLSFLSGLAESVGAVIGYFILTNLFNGITFGIVFASVAGIMVNI